MDVNDSYTELGLSADASDAEVKAAWRRLAARWHPDRNDSPQALRKIQRINRALDEIRRSRGVTLTVPASMDEEPAKAPATTVDQTASLGIEEALAGCERILQGEIVGDCVVCGGSGAQAHPTACDECSGAGRVKQHLWFSWVSPTVPCRACDGQGAVRHACPSCEGEGKAPPRRYRCRVRIPAGVRDGDVVHAGARGQDGEELDLRVRIALQPHPIFRLDEDGTVKCEVPVDGFAWVANRWIEVPTPGGMQQMRLRREHRVYRIRGEGFPVGPDGARADCIVTVVPLFPEEFSREQEALVDKLVAANTKHAKTPGGKQMAAWNDTVRRWKASRS